jgi:hypothetical protein
MKGVELLPFEVERQDLRNTVACMQLMDIAGLVILGNHRNEIWPHLPRLHPVARRSRVVDTLARKGRTMVGYNAVGMACLNWARKTTRPGRGKKPIALIAGGAPEIPSAAAALLGAGWNVIHYRTPGRGPQSSMKGIRHTTKLSSLPPNPHLLITGQMAKSCAAKLATALKKQTSVPVLLDLRGSAGRLKFRGSPRLGKKKLQDLFYLTCADILTSGKAT